MFFWHMRAWTDFLQMTGTFFLTLLFSIEVGVASDSFLLAQGATLLPRHAATPQSRKADRMLRDDTPTLTKPSDWTRRVRGVLLDPRRAKVDADADQDHWQTAQHGGMGPDRRGRGGAGGASGSGAYA
jgi:hypothetical protein